MILMAAIFGCLSPVLTLDAGLAYRDPFVLPIDKKQQADEVKRRLAGGARDYVWRHFLSEKTLQMMGDMRQQFLQLLQGIGFTETPGGGRGRRTGDPAFDDNSGTCGM
eukprot:gene13347-15772_t